MIRKLGFWSALTGSLLWASCALAEPSAADRATARALAGEGYQALKAKDYSTAADRFSRADALVHAPTLMIDWARSLIGMGKLVEAQERYEQIMREGVDAKSPRSWQTALSDAGIELAQLKPRLAWVTITVAGSNDAHVSIDGAVVPPAAVGVRRAVNPGERVVRVTANGFLPQKMELQLSEGGDSNADFTLEPDPDAQAAVVAPPPPPPPPAPVARHDQMLTYVAFGVGGAGLVVGGVTGAMALSKRSQLSSACNSAGKCPSDEGRTLSSYHSLGTVSGVGFAVGVAGVGAGVALWLLNRNTEPTPAQGLVVHPFLGIGSVGAMGSF
jgi:hypothetical protein